MKKTLFFSVFFPFFNFWGVGGLLFGFYRKAASGVSALVIHPYLLI
jgi:hypothetical protein